MTPQPELAAGPISGTGTEEPAAPAAGANPFVLNLCSSSTPMALAQTDLPELKRFTFFVSRRFEEGRERFRLHMGYFATLAEAEEWLNVVREIYPGAWAGEAPGRKLRERAAAAAAAQAQHAAGPRGVTRTASAPARAPVAFATTPAARALPPREHVPVVHGAPPRATRLVIPPVARPAALPMPRAAPLQGASVARSVPAVTPPLAPRPAAALVRRAPPARAAAPAPGPGLQAAAPARPQAPAGRSALLSARGATPAPAKPAFADSNVREVLAALGETSATGETRLMNAPPPRRAAALESNLSDSQVLRVLEDRRPDEVQDAPEVPASTIPLLKPDDTGTRAALKEAVATNAPVWFAVQLHWSVQPVELDKVPPLAIFSAYTLYTVEGSREGRRWYGLRLGFFSDAISAKQVAYYVRSEFASVAVVPVSPEERARATDEDPQAATFSSPAAAPRPVAEEFKLIDHDVAPPPPAPRPQPSQPPARPALKPLAKPARPATHSSKAAAKGRARSSGRVGARERRGPQTLEETLEILGASQLSIDPGSCEILNDTGVRHLRVEVQKNSPFARLLDRLSERLRKP